MKSRDEIRTRTIRMALAAVNVEEVAGKTARELSDDEVNQGADQGGQEAPRGGRGVQRRRPHEAGAGRGGRAGRCWKEYLPAQLTDEELGGLVDEAIAETGAAGPQAMGQVMKAVTPAVAGRADGARVAAEVRRQLGA